MVAAIGQYSSAGSTGGSGNAAQVAALAQQLASLQQQLIKTDCVQTQKTLTQQIASVQARLSAARASPNHAGNTVSASLSASPARNSTTSTQGNVINTTA